MADRKSKSICFPKVESIRLVDFDLYTDNPDVSVDLNRPVFCLIGANGLGKTTFLNTLNFAITGALPNTSKKYLDDKKYFKDNSQANKISDYFSGRISEEARQTASVEVKLAWQDKTIIVRRSLFNGSEIVELKASSNVASKVANIEFEDGDLEKIYQKEVLELTGLEEFSQFVFLVHYIWTFDEDRHLLMWDDKALTDALYLAFGSNPEQARTAAKLRLEIERFESNARNAKYAAKQLSDHIEILAGALEKADNEIDSNEDSAASLRETYDALIADVVDKQDRVIRKRSELQEADLKWAELSSGLSEAMIEYQRVFNEHFKGTSSVHHHPVVKATISENECAVCHTVDVAAVVRKIMDDGKCPLCRSEITPTTDAGGRDQIKQLDKHIAKLQKSMQSVLLSRERLSAEYDAAMATQKATEDALADFENAKPEFKLDPAGDVSSDALSRQITDLERQGDLLTNKSEELYRKRDEKRKNLRQLEKSLRVQYEEGATEFVPRFRELAESFIGIPIDIQINEYSGATKSGFGLSLLMDDSLRLKANTVSESQGFFIDIALRMSLAEFMSATPATLLIDTPEGSLDIAYEARAGAMFSNFVKNGNNIVMTANLRSSELVVRLAQKQSKAGMQIVKMTEWTELSDVQREEEELFTKAYKEIESALEGTV